MDKKKNLIFGIIIVLVITLFLIIKPSFTGNAILNNEQKIKLGYCPTMQEDAKVLSEKENYDLIRFGSASEVLFALNNNQIDKGLIGRKAKDYEISDNIKETILKSGYTLVTNQKSFLEYYNLPQYEIYTYLEGDFNFPIKKISKEKVSEKIEEGKIVLISWDDWKDDFELIVVIKGNEKVKDFRRSFLYEIQ